MKRFIAGVVVGFVASCAVAFASADANHNGLFWNTLNRAAKDGYVNGYADAMRVSVSKLDTLTTAGDLFHWKGSRKIIHELETQLRHRELGFELMDNLARSFPMKKVARGRQRIQFRDADSHRIGIAVHVAVFRGPIERVPEQAIMVRIRRGKRDCTARNKPHHHPGNKAFHVEPTPCYRPVVNLLANPPTNCKSVWK